MSEKVNHPEHYSGGKVECIDAIESAVAGLPSDEAFCLGNVFKYLWRYDRKNGAEDVAKARWYVDRLEKLVARRAAGPAKTAAKPVDDKSDCERADRFGMCKETNAKCPETRCFLYRKTGDANPINRLTETDLNRLATTDDVRRPETDAERRFIDDLVSAVKTAEGEDADGDVAPFIRVVRVKGGPAVMVGVRGTF